MARQAPAGHVTGHGTALDADEQADYDQEQGQHDVPPAGESLGACVHENGFWLAFRDARTLSAGWWSIRRAPLQMTHRTVKSLADAARPEDLFRGQWQHNRTSVLDEYKPYLDERWDEGCTNAWKLWEEIVLLGLSRQLRPGQRLPAREADLATAGHRATAGTPRGDEMDSQPTREADRDRTAPAHGRPGRLP
ncbi:hypothetical protein [Streptomyces flavidovirens]